VSVLFGRQPASATTTPVNTTVLKNNQAALDSIIPLPLCHH
jgi:hypothetical protein